MVDKKLHGLKHQKTNAISFTRETNSVHSSYHNGDVLILRINCVKHFDVMLANKLYFHHDMNYIFSQALWLLRLVRS
jgi:hypothetical protein